MARQQISQVSFGIEIAAGIVGDAREMNDGVDAGQIDRIGVANVALDHGEIGMRLEEIAEPHDVERHDLVARLEQLGNEHAALVAAGAGHENLHRRIPYPDRPARSRVGAKA